MQRANPANPLYVDTRARFTASAQEHGQTSDPNRQVPTQNLSGTTQFTTPEFTKQPTASGVESSNPAQQVPHIDEVSQGEKWEARVQIGHSTTGKMFWNVDGMKPKERLAYFEKMVAWYEGECQRAPQLSRRSAALRLIAGFVGSLRRWWGRKLTREQRQHILSRDDPCGSLLENLSLDFLGQFTREEEVAEKQFLQNKFCDVRKMKEYYLEQEMLYYTFDKTSDTIHRTFVLNMPGPVAEMMEAKFKANEITDLSQLNIAQLYQMVMELIQSHCRSQDLRKHMKHLEKSFLQKFCNEEPNKFGCQHTDKMCSCTTGK